MKTIFLLLAFAFCQNCFGGTNLNTIAVSDWSETVDSTAPGLDGSIRGRLHILEGFSPQYGGKLAETLVYLELQNMGSRGLEIYYDFQKGLRGELRDINNQLAPPIGSGGSGGFPGPSWITLPKDSSIRLRASWYGYGMPKEEGLMIPLYRHLILKAENTNQYFLNVIFTVSPSTNHVSSPNNCVWEGTLTLPKMKISAKRP